MLSVEGFITQISSLPEIFVIPTKAWSLFSWTRGWESRFFRWLWIPVFTGM